MLGPEEKLNILEKAVLEARGHLGAALVQVIDADDKIIVEHVANAERELAIALRTVGA